MARLKNEEGFALSLMMALLPVLLAGFIFAYASFGFVRVDLAMKYQCRTDGQSGQRKTAPLLEKLLSLNPNAIKLRAEWGRAKTQLKAARASGYPLRSRPLWLAIPMFY